MKDQNFISYFKDLFQNNRVLFILVLIFFALNLNSNFFFGGQQSPFFYWKLYADPFTNYDTVSFFETRYNDNKKLVFKHTWQAAGAGYGSFIGQVGQYALMIQNGGIALQKDYIDNWNRNHPFFRDLTPGLKFYPDSVDMKKFPEWYIQRIEDYTGEKIDSLDIYEIRVAYLKDGFVHKVSERFIGKIR